MPYFQIYEVVFTIIKERLDSFKDAVKSKREMLVLCKNLKGSKQLPFAAQLEDRHIFVFSVASTFDFGGKS